MICETMQHQWAIIWNWIWAQDACEPLENTRLKSSKVPMGLAKNGKIDTIRGKYIIRESTKIALMKTKKWQIYPSVEQTFQLFQPFMVQQKQMIAYLH